MAASIAASHFYVSPPTLLPRGRSADQFSSNATFRSLLGTSEEPFRLKIDARRTGTSPARKRVRRRQLRRVDPKLEHKKQETPFPFLQHQELVFKESGKQVLVDAERLMNQCNNKFALVLDIAAEATEFLINNPEEALVKKPILKVISDRMNEAAGMKLSDAYLDVLQVYSEEGQETNLS